MTYKKFFTTYSYVNPHEFDLNRINTNTKDILYNPEIIQNYNIEDEDEAEEVLELTYYYTQSQTPLKSKRKFKSKKQYDHTISFEQLLKNIGANVRITSSFRPNGKTSSGNVSNHSKKDLWGMSMAYDIVPIDGDFEKLKKLFLTNEEARNWFNKRGYGIINEIIPQVKNKTKATGNHFHIGPDKWAQRVWNKWIEDPGILATLYIE